MKTRMLILITFLVLAVLIVVGSCATQKQAYIPKTNEELYGTWVNKDYDGVERAQKFINYNWGYTEIYDRVTESVGARGTFYIMDKWTNAVGIIWYKATWQFRGSLNMRFYLVEINENKGSWEEVWSYNEFPSESDLTPDHVNYGIWYRQ